MLIDYSLAITCTAQSQCLTQRVQALDDLAVGDVALDFPTYGQTTLENAVNAFVNDLLHDRYLLQVAMKATAETVCQAWTDMQQIDEAAALSLTRLQAELDGTAAQEGTIAS